MTDGFAIVSAYADKGYDAAYIMKLFECIENCCRFKRRTLRQLMVGQESLCLEPSGISYPISLPLF